MAAVALSACHAPGGASPMNTDASERTIELKERPDPQRAYRIVMTIRDAPGPFAFVEGSAQHDVTNHRACGEINRSAGTISRINTNPPIDWQKISDTQYSAMVYADLMQDEDYFGRGLCRWSFTEARARLKATGAEAETRFVPAISAEEIFAGQAVTWYFWKQRYLINTPLPSNGKGIADFGQKNLDGIPAERRDEFFSIALTPMEAEP
jgi:hypothetical protein